MPLAQGQGCPLMAKGLPRWLSGKESPLPMQEMQDMQVRSLGREDPLEKKMATHSGILVWEIPWTGEPAGLQCMGSQSHGQGSLLGCSPWVLNTMDRGACGAAWVLKEVDTTEQLSIQRLIA